jgi:hypothetical protein
MVEVDRALTSSSHPGGDAAIMFEARVAIKGNRGGRHA